ncbi:MAG: phosphate acyltransferase PlsX [Clostridia bacterium]|nr:phosphate acyltransferase PlsX [Clostridia bacterium]
MVKLAVDVMGGDYSPGEQVKGVVNALAKDDDLEVVLYGDEEAIKAELAKYKYDESQVSIVHADEVISGEEVPTKAIKTRKNSSMVMAYEALKSGEVDGLVSSGSTGALLAGGILKLGRIKGISRPALCPTVPNGKGKVTIVCDSGANVECKPVNLVHFAIMATAYAQSTYGIENPTVGLLNNGTEDHKGDEAHQEANRLLKQLGVVNYIGNVEGRAIMLGDADVVVCDGYTGNTAIKGIEGCAKAVSNIMKKSFKKNLWTKLRALLVKDIIDDMKKSMDYEAVGGAVFLGFPKAIVKAHGNARAKGFGVSIGQAAAAVRNDMVGKINKMLESVDTSVPVQE